jgi:hypothetical protein
LNAQRAAAFAPKALRRAAPELVENNREWRRENAEDRLVLLEGILCGLRGLCVDRLKV